MLEMKINKRKLILIVSMILGIILILLLINFIKNHNENMRPTIIEEKLIVIAKEVEKENEISLMGSSGKPHITYNLRTLKKVYNKDIKEFKNCDLDNTYITIYPEKKKKEKYEVNLDCE